MMVTTDSYEEMTIDYYEENMYPYVNISINLNPKHETRAIPVDSVILVIVNILIILLGVCGNGIVIWISGVKMKRSINSTWYLSLAVSDFIFCASLPFDVVYMATSNWPFGLYMCKFTSFIMLLNMFSSIFLLVLISVDRCVSVIFPVWAQNHRTVKAASVLVVLAWIISVGLSIPSVISRVIEPQGYKIKCYNNYDQVSHKTIAYSRFVCVFLIPFLIIILCYTIIVVKLKSSRLTKSSKPLKVMSALIVTFFVCWLPYHIFALMETENHNNPIGQKVSVTLAYANSFINPFLYAFMGKDFKKTCWRSVLSKIENAMSDEARTISKRLTSSLEGRVSTEI